MNAAQLKKGQQGTIVRVNGDEMAQRLLEMGFLPGALIKLTGKGPLGNPLAFRVGLLHAALRSEEAALIEINQKEEEK